MKTIIILLAGVVCWSACQQPSTTESPATDSMELNNRGYIPVDTENKDRTDTTSYDSMNNKPKADSMPR